MREAVDTFLMEAASRGRPVHLVPGEVLIEEGDQYATVYVLASGSLAVSRSQGNGSIALTTSASPEPWWVRWWCWEEDDGRPPSPRRQIAISSL